MGKKVLIICVDGLGPEYLEAAPTPNIDQMAREGSFVIGRSVIPSVTNVNNVSIITGAPPRVHGITSNYWLNSETDSECYMESPEFLRCATILQRAKGAGLSTALITSKKKLLRLLNAGADYSMSAEVPDGEMIRKIGPARDIYSADINIWLFKALLVILEEKKPDLVYCSTTDGMMHKYAPENEESQRHISGLDSILGRIVNDNPDIEIYLTADHGMTEKTRGVDLEKILQTHGIESRAVPIIKDRYTAHHNNLGGASYIFIKNPGLIREAMEILKDLSVVEEVYPRGEAAEQFDLMGERIGDIFALGDKDTVFGGFEQAIVPVKLRSHGSRYESSVPIISYGSSKKLNHEKNYDITGAIKID